MREQSMKKSAQKSVKTVFILDKIGHHHPLLCLQQTFPRFLCVIPFAQLPAKGPHNFLHAHFILFPTVVAFCSRDQETICHGSHKEQHPFL